MLIIDACTVINVFNSGLCNEVVSGLCGGFVLVGSVVDEIDGRCAVCIERIMGVSENVRGVETGLNAKELSEFSCQNRIGIGEAEAIFYASRFSNSIVVSDDKKARNVATKLLGEARVTGTIGLLRKLVFRKVITVENAMLGLEKAVSAGGFLPPPRVSLFESA